MQNFKQGIPEKPQVESIQTEQITSEDSRESMPKVLKGILAGFLWFMVFFFGLIVLGALVSGQLLVVFFFAVFFLVMLYFALKVSGIKIPSGKDTLLSQKNEYISKLEQEIVELKEQLSPDILVSMNLSEQIKTKQNVVDDLSLKLDKLCETIEENAKTVSDLDLQISAKSKELATFDDKILVQDFGLYEPRFDFASSSQFKDALNDLRIKEREDIKQFDSSLKATTWTVNGSNAKGRKMVADVGRLLMRAYNNECDVIISKVKYTNISKSIEQIKKHADAVNRFGQVLGISIPSIYVDKKVEEAQLAFEFARQKEKEKEALREAREEERENRKLAQEVAAKRRELQKEKEKYSNAYTEAKARLEHVKDDEREALLKKISELEEKLNDVDKAVANVDYREANIKAGYVYIISNIGSFGENVYKIGMTRRLDPMDRIRELGDASVPFGFDVHALIFSDDAPALEASLHRAFEKDKVNLVNPRREFFHVSLADIKEVVKAHYDKTVEFAEVPDADQYRESVELRKNGIIN